MEVESTASRNPIFVTRHATCEDKFEVDDLRDLHRCPGNHRFALHFGPQETYLPEGSWIVLNVMKSSAVLCGALIICICSFECAAQSKRQSQKNVLPRVGTIKDYPATGLMTGCGNLYFYSASQAKPSPDAYVFLARGDGSNAWMNLGGRDVRLRQIRSLTRDNRKTRRFYYRHGNLRVSVVIEDFKPETETVAEGDSMDKMKITLRQGRAVRIVRAVGDADC